ncbi:MAG: hypothetical protein WCO35_02825 [Candidatus Nomurabacteria bacterium]
MLYIICGTDFKKRENAREKILQDLKKQNINFETLLSVSKINKENYTLLPNYFGSVSLFGEKILINIDDILSKEESREYFYEHIKDFIKSENIFIADEPFILSPTFQKLYRDLGKENLSKNLFDAKDDNKDKDIEPFYFCELIEKRDKRKAWEEFQKIYLEWEDSEAQALHGALWWKWKNMMSASVEGNKFNYARIWRLTDKEIHYSKEELEKFGFQISLMAMRANNGELNLMRSIERFILSI